MTTVPPEPRLLLLGWPGADWRMIQPLLDQGRMPHLQSLIENGVMGKLVAQEPLVPSASWSTLATGVLADRHNILGLATLPPGAEKPVPMDASDLAARPLWDLVTRAGRTAAAVCWPVTHPATVFDSVVISDAFPESRAEDFDSWPLMANSVSDPDLRDIMWELRLHLNDLAPEQVSSFVPRAMKIDQETDERLPLLMAALARAVSTHAAGTWLAEHRPGHLLAVHYNLIERLSNAFLDYRAPRQPQVTQIDFEIYRHVVDAAYLFMDMLLGRYLELVDAETSVMIVSDHGYLGEHLRPPGAAAEGKRTPRDFSRLGIFACRGPGVKHDELVFGASLRDVAPTALHLLGLPVPQELEGQVLQRIFCEPREPAVSHQPIAMAVTAPAAGEEYTEWAADRLREWAMLGYMAPLDADPECAAEQCALARLANLAAVKRLRGEFNAALTVYRDLLEIAPEDRGARLGVAQCHFQLRDAALCRAALDDLAASGVRDPMVDLLFGQLSLLEGDVEQAQACLHQAREAGMQGRLLQEMVGRAYLQAQNWQEAARSFRTALELDPDFAAAHSGLGLALHRLDEQEAAIEHFMRSLGLLYAQPHTHYYLGVALARVGRLAQARQALEHAIELRPGFTAAQAALRKVDTAGIKAMMAEVEADTDVQD